jgi:hypothetical protein
MMMVERGDICGREGKRGGRRAHDGWVGLIIVLIFSKGIGREGELNVDWGCTEHRGSSLSKGFNWKLDYVEKREVGNLNW